MTNEQIEQKIKSFKSKLKEIELQIARDEQKLTSKQEEELKIKEKLIQLYPSIDLDNLDVELQKIETTLEAEILAYEQELLSINSILTSN